MGPFLRSTRHGLFAASLLALLLFVTPAVAAWNPAGEPVPVADCSNTFSTLAACDDGSRGLFTFWADHANPPALFAQRRLADGSLAPGWLAAGNPIGHGGAFASSFVAVPAPDGGAWLVAPTLFFSGEDHRVHVWRVTGAGALAPGWPDGGVALGDPGTPKDALLADDGTGGVLVGWVEPLKYEFRGAGPTLFTLNAVRLVRLDGYGVPVSGWSALGNPVFVPDTTGPLAIRRVPTRMIADGTGGAWICHADSTDGVLDSRLFRMTAGGALAAGFPVEGVLVGLPGATQKVWSIASDGAAGIFTSGGEVHGLLDTTTRLTRFQASGEPAPGWTASGIAMLPDAAGYPDISPIVADGAGGVVAACAFDDSTSFTTRFRFQRFGPDGAAPPGWPAGGVALDEDLGVGRAALATLQSDGAGGAFLVGSKDRPGGPSNADAILVAAHVGGDGTYPADWSSQPTVIDTVKNGVAWVATGDRRGALFVIHSTPKDGSFCPELARRFGPDGSSTSGVDDPPAVVHVALRTYPNPMTTSGNVRLTIPFATWVSVDVLDSSGRRVRTLGHVEVGPGDRRFEWDGRDSQGRAAPPGVYLFRVRGPGLDHSERIVRLL